MRESGGLVLGVEDDQMLSTQGMIAKKEALFVEPASSATVAAVKMLLDNGTIDRQDTIVCIANGSRLNEPEAVFSSHQESPTLKPTVEAP
jgi:threonine synthase